MLTLYAHLIAFYIAVLVGLVLLLIVPTAYEHYRWSRDRRGRGGRYVR